MTEASTEGLKSDQERRTDHHLAPGWRGGVALCVGLTTIVLILNVICLILSAVSKKDDGFAVAFQGKCRTASWLMLTLHMAINLLSTALLSASNYCMQILSAPTRAEIDAAHAKHEWLDIGLQSLRNLRRIPTKRMVFWCLLVVSSVPLHLLYNSAVIPLSALNEYPILVVTSSFLSNTETYASNVTQMRHLLPGTDKSGTRIDYKTCTDLYYKGLSPKSRDVIVVLNATTLPNYPHSVVYYGNSTIQRPIGIDDALQGVRKDFPDQATDCEAPNCPVAYCLAQLKDTPCRLLVAPSILAVVVVCNLCKVVAIYLLYRSRHHKNQPLVTLGDAISSFLEHRDETTAQRCLMDKRMVTQGLWKADAAPQPFHAKKWFGYRAWSLKRWMLCTGL